MLAVGSIQLYVLYKIHTLLINRGGGIQNMQCFVVVVVVVLLFFFGGVHIVGIKFTLFNNLNEVQMYNM